MNKFRKDVNKINIADDIFVKKSKTIFGIYNPKLKGSFIKYGKEKSCDLDMYEEIPFVNLDNRNNIIKDYLDKLDKNKNKFKLIYLYVYIKDLRIDNIINELGYITGTFQIINCNLNFDIDKTLPENIKEKIIKKRNKLKEEFNIKNYIKLHRYLYRLNYPSWKLSEIIKGVKNINGINIKLYETNFNNIYLEVIFENYKVTNYISFINGNNIKQESSNYYCICFNDLIDKKHLSYYIVLKKYQVFLKWAYFNRIFKSKYLIENAVNYYNEIFDFRENIGTQYFELCTLDNKILLNGVDKKELKKQYKIGFKKINKNSKILIDKITKIYNEYLNSYLRFI